MKKRLLYLSMILCLFITGCNKNNSNETTETTISTNTDATNTDATSNTNMWYVNQVEFSNEEFVEIENGKEIFGDKFVAPITKEQLFKANLSSDLSDTLEKSYNESETFSSFNDFIFLYENNYAYPKFIVNTNNIKSIDDFNMKYALDNDYWTLYLQANIGNFNDNMNFSCVSEIEFDENITAQAGEDSQIVTEFLQRFGKPNYYSTNFDIIDSKLLVDEMFRELDSNESLTVCSNIGYKTKDFYLLCQYTETYSNNEYIFDIDGFYYVPIGNKAVVDICEDTNVTSYVMEKLNK